LASVRLHPATGSHPYKWARCRAEQVSIAVCAMDVTPETRKGRPHAPWPAPLSHPRKRGPCSELCRPLLRRPRAHLAVVRALPDADFASFPTGEESLQIALRQMFSSVSVIPRTSGTA